MMIPIHAYPKMNIHMVDYVPRFVDFGTVGLNTTGRKEIYLRNIINLPFEFEFVPVKICKEIKMEPLCGEVESVSNKAITFTFSPQSYGLFISEYEFRLSEFEYKPFVITVTGNCNVFDKVLNENILIHMKKQRDKKSNLEKLKTNSNNNNSDDIYSVNSNKNPKASEFAQGQHTINSPKSGFSRSVNTPNSKLNNNNKNNANDMSFTKQINENNNNNINNHKNNSNEANLHPNPINEENETLASNRSNKRNSLNTNNIEINQIQEENEENVENLSNRNEILTPAASSRYKENSTNTNLISQNNKNNFENQELSIANKSSSFNRKFRSFPSTKEREFLNYYNQIESTIKDKEIKYLKFIGKKLLTDDQINRIVSERIKEFETNLSMKRNMDLNRFKFELDTNKCTVDRLNQYYLKPTFNFNFNDKFFKTRNYFKIFLKLITKVVVRSRAEKNYNRLKNMLAKQNIKNAKDFSEYAERDWTEQLTKDQETQESKMKIKFVKPQVMVRSPVYLCYDYNLESLKQEINHENNINLEELYQYNKLDVNDVEVIGYKGN